jgi:D-alanyl-lipoteichoic acid acyltransferase DltB (MBOAT superfamily)
MVPSQVNLSAPTFWLFLLVAALILTPLIHAASRHLLLAAINLAFLWTLLGYDLLAVLAGLGLFYLILRAASSSTAPRILGITIGLAGGLALFVLHKLPWLGGQLHAPKVNPVLMSIGYSYVFLRMIEVLRATWQHNTPPPGMVALVNYLLPFHMLAAGPIQAWGDFVAQPPVPAPITFNQALTMIERIVQGLFKKYVLAYAVNAIFLSGQPQGWYRLVVMNMSYIWLYLDFSAYSDIAIGAGGLLGVATPENFNRPYIARNMTDFWERWHISLSLWIRRNLFFPIQIALLRRTQARYALACASVAIFISFMLCGAWHGLTLPFLYWGLANSIGLVVVNLYRFWLKKRLGGKGVARYMASWPIRLVAILMTFEYMAFTNMLILAKWGGTS